MRCLLAVLCLIVLGCSDERVAGVPLDDIKVEGTIYCTGGSISPLIFITRAGEPVDNAYLEVNGLALTYDMGAYIRADIPAIAASIGDPITMSITTRHKTLELESSVPDKPSIRAPTSSGSPYRVALPLTVKWNTLSPAPMNVYVWVWEGYTSDYATYIAGDSLPIYMSVGGGDTQAVIQANSLATHNATTSPGYGNMTLEVRAVNSVALPAGIDVGSYLRVVSTTESEVFTTE